MKITSLLLLIPFILLLLGCSKSDQRADGRIELKYWEVWTGDEAKAMADVADKFNASQGEIFVNFISTSELDRKVMLATAGGNPPDIAGVISSQISTYAENGARSLRSIYRELILKKRRLYPISLGNLSATWIYLGATHNTGIGIAL